MSAFRANDRLTSGRWSAQQQGRVGDDDVVEAVAVDVAKGEAVTVLDEARAKGAANARLPRPR